MKAVQHKYTLVQHSGFGFAGKPAFEHAVEERAVTKKTELDRVKKLGGVIFDDYSQASDAADRENYPPGVEGLVPRAKGTFAKFKIAGLALYIPRKDEHGDSSVSHLGARN